MTKYRPLRLADRRRRKRRKARQLDIERWLASQPVM